MPNVINRMILRELSTSFAGVEGMFIVSMTGLSVAETEALRTALAEEGVRLRMVRNRLARRALADNGVDLPDGVLTGNVAFAWGSQEDAIHAAKVLVKSPAGKQGKVVVRGGFLEGEVLGPADAGELAELPDRDELRARILGVVSGPARSLASLLAAPSGSLARVLQARVDAEGGAGDGG